MNFVGQISEFKYDQKLIDLMRFTIITFLSSNIPAIIPEKYCKERKVIMLYLYPRKKKFNYTAVISVSECSQVLLMLLLFKQGR